MSARAWFTFSFLLPISLVAVTLSGCSSLHADSSVHASRPSASVPIQTSTVAETPAQTPNTVFADRQAEYAATVASFPLPLPQGYAFPQSAPTSGLDGHAVAYRWWRCAVAQAARDAEVNHADYATAGDLLTLITRVSDADLPGNAEWVNDVIKTATPGQFNAALEGETGVCYFWAGEFRPTT
jgi:hypothetical protein